MELNSELNHLVLKDQQNLLKLRINQLPNKQFTSWNLNFRHRGTQRNSAKLNFTTTTKNIYKNLHRNKVTVHRVPQFISFTQRNKHVNFCGSKTNLTPSWKNDCRLFWTNIRTMIFYYYSLSIKVCIRSINQQNSYGLYFINEERTSTLNVQYFETLAPLWQNVINKKVRNSDTQR